MVYREQARDIAGAEERRDETLIAFDVTGRVGQRGRDGGQGHDGVGSGAAGGRGGDATSATSGGDGGRMLLQLSPGHGPETVAIDGDLWLGDGRHLAVDDELSFGADGYVDLHARGGRGGDGGHGGRGGDGARGHSGRDATRYSSGGDGGPGGRGGDGGNATSGAPGGKGGAIEVVVAEPHCHLLMLLRHDVRGGDGGQPGVNGPGGAGGPGGPGGSSYHWTETETYTDSQGKTQSRTRHRSNSGGSRGPSGSSGSTGRAVVTPGPGGPVGELSIEVRGDDGTARRYPSRYHLRLAGFKHESENADGIYEPDERVRVFDVEIDNVGGMPTPTHSDAELRLEPRGWVQPEDACLTLPRSIPAGMRVKLPGPLWFSIGDFQPQTPDQPLAIPETIHQRCGLPDVRRDFLGFDHLAAPQHGAFSIRFPVEVTPLEALRALGPGEATKLRFRVDNRSKKALGRGSECGRVLRFRLYTKDSELGDAHALLFDEAGHRVSLDDGWEVEIDRLEGGESRAFEVALGVTEDAPLYRRLGLWLSLELGRIERPYEARAVQHRALDVRVASLYRAPEGANVLLVVNHRTESEELEAWRAQLKRLGLVAAVWDLSREGGIDLDAPQADGQSLAERFSGGSMIVLNNHVETPAGEDSAHRVIGKPTVVAAAAHGIDVLFVGNDVGIQQLLEPTHLLDLAMPEAGEVEDASEEEVPLAEVLEKSLVKQSTDALALTRARGAVYDMDWLGRGPDTRVMAKTANRILRRLAARHPSLRLVAVTHVDKRVDKRFLWIRRWHVGQIEIRATLTTEDGRLVSVEAPRADACRPDYIASDDTLLALLLTRSFAEKLEQLDRAVAAVRDQPPDAPPSPGDALVARILEALVVDLAQEIRGLLLPGWRSGMGLSEMDSAMPRLRALAAFEPRGAKASRLDPASTSGGHVIALVAKLRRFVYGHTRFWEWLPPMVGLRRAPMLWWLVRKHGGAFLDRLFGGDDAIAKAYRKDVKERLDVARRELKAAFEEYRQGVAGEDRYPWHYRHADELVFGPLLRRGVTSDAEVYVTEDTRLLTSHALADASERDQRREAHRRQVLVSSSQARRDLALDTSTAGLLDAPSTH
ncbi:MAG: hypothetical protein R3B72_19545 [Polyangiaceae bacterium]